MVLRTCLLVSDDPDDHIQFTEALYEVSRDIVLLAVMDPHKALDLISLKRHIPDYIILDLEISGLPADEFFKALEADPGLENIPLIAYGEFSQFAKIQNGRITAFIDNDFTYSGLRNQLIRILKS